jgi:hypothetical protein
LGLPRATGFATVVLICFAPHSFVFSVAYAESTFLALLAAAVLALRRRQYGTAGVAAALLSATRPNGVLYVLFAFVHIIRTVGWQVLLRPWTEPRPLLTLALAPLGLIAYWWFCLVTTGDAFAQKTTLIHGWYWQLDWPWSNLLRHLTGSAADRFWAMGSLLLFGASTLLLPMRRFEEFIYCSASFLLVWSNVNSPSLIRYGVVLFPIFVAIAFVCLRRPVLLAFIASAFATVNTYLLMAFVLRWPISV